MATFVKGLIEATIFSWVEIGSATDHNIEKSMFADKWLFDQLQI